ncbi:hypothetical protein CAFE_17600 [Caprobacter fermentans]|uniref:Uncharacterized protein n=1 Tax=Caproicibacter fermentans TaxID=2576756 RepID=A0A6N8HZG0_9FIRM|nr:hypothetical protein [Caproicibacter fermentans]
MMRQPPCYGCSDRALGCHSDCPRWVEWKEQEHRVQEAVRKAKGTEQAFQEISCKRSRKILKQAVHNRTRGRRAY